MATTTQAPLEVYLLSDFSPDAEYIDGEIKERPVGENDHSALQLAICTWFAAHAAEWKIRVRPELRIQVTSRNFLVADVAILDASAPKERFATRPPVAVFEVLSPENSMREMLRKCQLYREMGTPQIWLIDPSDRIWRRSTEEGLVPATEFAYEPLGINFSLSEITNRIDD
ncbi:MAG TPA: Uma2 family endonuclease [Acidobacteriaceae bacterium]